MTKKDRIGQEWANRAKTLRTAIRTKHSIAADNEINERLPAEEKKFWDAVQHQKVLAPLALESAPPQDETKFFAALAAKRKALYAKTLKNGRRAADGVK